MSGTSCTVPFPFFVFFNTGDGNGMVIGSFIMSHSIYTKNISAVSAVDYVAVSNQSVRFAPCAPEYCINISTINDEVVDGEERFFVTLSRSASLDSRINVDHKSARAEIVIIDDDGESYIMWNNKYSLFRTAARVTIQNPMYEVNENEGMVQVCAMVRSPFSVRPDCHLDFSFTLRLTATPGTAGNIKRGLIY